MQNLQCSPTIHILYASQTGNARQLAYALASEIPIVSLLCQFNTEYEFIPHSIVLILASTCGRGDAPYAARQMWQSMLNQSFALPAGVRFAVFALGDSGYGDDFNVFGRKLRMRMKGLSAMEIVPIGLGDHQDEKGHLHEYGQWLIKLKDYLLKQHVIQNNGILTIRDPPLHEIEIISSTQISKLERRQTYLVEFKCASQSIHPGDILEVYPHNNKQTVLRCIKQWKINTEEHLTLSKHLNIPKHHNALQILTEDLNLADKDGNPFEKLEDCTPMISRKYSIAQINHNQGCLLIKLKETLINAQWRQGVCSRDLTQGKGIRRGRILRGDFNEQSMKKQMAFIALGTGVSPFIPFLQNRHAQSTLLITCRHQQQLHYLHEKLILANSVTVHHSLTEKNGMRIQALLQSQMAIISNTLKSEGAIWVCAPKAVVDLAERWITEILSITKSQIKKRRILISQIW